MNEDQLLEQYKLYVELADRVSDRRIKTNQFYITLLSGLLLAVSFAIHKDHREVIGVFQPYVMVAVGLLGTILCLIWQFNIRSYRQLNSRKFEVIHEVEKHLPFPLFKREWDLLGSGKDSKKYYQLSKVEKLVPLVLLIPFFVLLVIGGWLAI